MKINMSHTLAWEDGVLAVLTLGWVTAGGGMALFHFYTLMVMLLILLLGLHRGLPSVMSRIAVISGLLLVFKIFGLSSDGSFRANIFLLAGGGALAGILGHFERNARQRLAMSFCQTLEALARTLEARDPYTEGHSRRVAQYALAIAQGMRLGKESQAAIEQAAILHDIGKIGVPDAILRKNGSLIPEEKQLMYQHPVIASRILSVVTFLKPAASLVLHHHEHFDGSGYPDGLSGLAIPLEDRILAVADVLDALTTDRPYHKAIRRTEAFREIEKEAGHLFDPEVIEVLKQADLDKPMRSFCPPCDDSLAA